MSDTTEPSGGNAAPEEHVTPTGGVAAPETAETEAPEASATADEPGADQAEDQTPAWAKKRFAELTARARAAERRAEMAEQLAMRPSQPAAPQGEPQLPQDIAAWVGPEPKPTDFAAGEFDPAFIRAAARYDMKFDQAKGYAAQRQMQVRQASAEFGARVASVMDATRAVDPGAIDTLTDPSFPMPQHVVREIVECEAPAKVLAHLARNPSDAARIAGLRSASAVARELTRIEAKISASPAPPPQQPTAAPPPPRTVAGRGATARPDPARMSTEELYAHRMANG